MAHYQDEGILPVPRAELWKLLDHHLDDRAILAIHPRITAQRLVRLAGNEAFVERQIAVGRGTKSSTWKLTSNPPDAYRWEVLDGDGPWAPGSFVANRYSDDPAGTMVRSEGELTIVGLPKFLQAWLARRVLAGIHSQDIAFLRGTKV
ncbi:MAG: hypothetical protein L3J93_05805 [Thermoplasmata archaeon]|nr:hypothetical protein [Thermoplasmata archaeon]